MRPSTCFTIFCEKRPSRRPVERIVVRTPHERSMAHRRNRSECIKGSPPEKTTHSTLSFTMSAKWPSSVAALISSRESSFQMSHMTQRQLQRLCGARIRIGSVSRRGFKVTLSCLQAGYRFEGRGQPLQTRFAGPGP